MKKCAKDAGCKISDSTLLELYHGIIRDDDFSNVFPLMMEEDFKKKLSIRHTRKRCISEYFLEFNGVWNINRLPTQPFSQELGMVSHMNIDYRLSKRIFKEMPDKLFNDDLRRLLRLVASRVQKARSGTRTLRVIIHHTLVMCFDTEVGDNSPEGIHQDGMDFIVSALCVERKNITGGKSLVYGADRITPIFEIELQAG